MKNAINIQIVCFWAGSLGLGGIVQLWNVRKCQGFVEVVKFVDCQQMSTYGGKSRNNRQQ
jgi:hypothetical protein